jgi:hypothetical protein
MLIKYTRSARRIIGELVWSRENRWTAEVTDAGLISELLTHPAYGRDFAVADEEPLAQIVGTHVAPLLVVEAGITTAAQLAALDAEGRKFLAGRMLETARTVNGWVSQAKALLDGEAQPANESALQVAGNLQTGMEASK